MAVNTAITFLQHMKIHYLIESEQESAAREAVVAVKLYRGVDEDVPDGIFRTPIRQDRIPKDSTFYEHVIFNAVFEKLFGFVDVRAKALFCTTDYNMAIDYGNQVVNVYPLKAAKLAYLPGCQDSGSAVSSLYHGFWSALAAQLNVDIYQVSSHISNKLGDNVPFLETQNPINSTAQLTQFIEVLDKVKPGLSSTATHALDTLGTALISQYVIIPSSEIASIPDEVEVMVINAPFYYAEKATNPWRDE